MQIPKDKEATTFLIRYNENAIFNYSHVLFKEYETSELMYLFPIDDFRAYAEEYQEEKLKKLYSENGEINKGASISFSDISGVENYLFDFAQGSVWYIIIVSAFSGAFVILFSVFNKKRQCKMGNNITK